MPGSSRPKRAPTNLSLAEVAGAGSARFEPGQRIVIEQVRPEVDEGRLLARGIVGETVIIEADIYCDGHDELAADILLRARGERTWIRAPMTRGRHDRWKGTFVRNDPGVVEYTIEAWIDQFARWRREFRAKHRADQATSVDVEIGARLLAAAVDRAGANASATLLKAAARLRDGALADGQAVASDPRVARDARSHPDRGHVARYRREPAILIERRRAGYGAWYEMFPRSASQDPGRPGTFADVEARLDYVSGMGFDVLYLPPIHPIGETHRKGRNNAVKAQPGDPGSPWAIGGAAGGHKSVNPDLGTLDDFRHLVEVARGKGIEIALDVALQCSPDHPYVTEHPEWFRRRPDGSIQYAENPPKKYQDIYPFDYETGAWESLWEEIRSIFVFWMEQGVRVFRVDNPHTKPFKMWQWCIDEIRKIDPGVVLLSEAFTRQSVMYRLASVGFTQSYTYFAWRNDKRSLTEYFTEITTPPVSDFYRPNAWPNTPDILTATLQTGVRAAFVTRVALAATLSACYGIYGPAYELMEHAPLEPGSEDYLNSDKYEVRHWNIEGKDSLRDVITALNDARRKNPALQSNQRLRFHDIDNERIIAYSKTSADGENVVLCVVNLDWSRARRGSVVLPLKLWGVPGDLTFEVEDLLSGETFQWRGARQRIRLDPLVNPARVFRVVLPDIGKPRR